MKTAPSSLFRFFFLDRIFGILLVILTVVAGYMAYNGLIKEATPDVKIPMALVSVEWSGTPAELIEKEITIPLETQIASVKGMKKYESTTQVGYCYLIVTFYEDEPLDQSMQKLRDAVNTISPSFPKKAENPTIEQISVSMIPVATFTLHGNVDDVILDRIANDLEDRFRTVPGLKETEISGNRKEIVKVLMIPSRLSSLGLSPVTVMEAINRTDLFRPLGNFEHQDFRSALKFDARVRDIETLRQLPVVRLGSGRIIRLEEVASVRRELEDANIIASTSFEGGEYAKTVDLTIYKLPGRDTVKIVERAIRILDEASRASDWPPTLEYHISHNEAKEIKTELSKVFVNIGQSMLAVFVILFIMLTWREALVAGLSIPLAFLATLTALWAIDYTLNELVIIGLILALGLLVDDFILIMEGMHEARSRGMSLIQAQIYTIKTYAVPSFSGSVTTILAFLPIMALSGYIGKFLRSIPVAAALCLVFSYLISIMVDVPLSAMIFSKRSAVKHTPGMIDRLATRSSEKLSAWLKRYTVRSKRVAVLWLVLTIVLFVVSVAAYFQIPSILKPKQDVRELGISVEFPKGTELEYTETVADLLGEELRELPYFENITKYVGRKSPFTPKTSETEQVEGSHFIGFSCKFFPETEREKKSFDYLPEIRQMLQTSLKSTPEAVLSVNESSSGEGYSAPITINVYGKSAETVRRLVKEVRYKLAQTPGVVNVRDDQGETTTKWRFEPIQESLDFYNISAEEVSSQLLLYLGENKIGKLIMSNGRDDLDIYLGMAWPSLKGKLGGPKKWQELERISIINSQGQRLHVESLVHADVEETPDTIERKNGRISISVLANDEGRSTSEILGEFLPQLEEMRQTWPAGYGFKFGGEFEELEELQKSAKRAFVIAVILIFSVLALIFGSFKQTLIIMLSVPFALIGTFLGFFLTGMSLSADAFVGIIALAGIAVNDAIVLIDTMNNHRKSGLSIADAAARGAGDRLRPILSTSITTIVGLIPLALSDREWLSLCNAIIFGLIASTLISLYVIPALYLLFTPKQQEKATEEDLPSTVPATVASS